ncbi:MAG: DMT family transporter, partial [Pseudomonadota bacterium]
MLLSVLTAAAMTFAVRWASEEMSSSVIVFMRAIGGLILALLVFGLLRSRVGPMRFSAPRLHIWRGAVIGVSTQLGFYTISEVPLATATVLFFSAPIFAALLAIPLQGEWIGVRRAAAIIAGFVGVLIVLRPGAVPVTAPVLAALASSFLFALALMSARGLAEKDGPLSAYFSSAAMTLIVSAPAALPIWSAPASVFGWAALAIVVVVSMARNIAD